MITHGKYLPDGSVIPDILKTTYNFAVAANSIGIPICESVDVNVALYGTIVSSSRLNFTSVIAKNAADNLPRRSVFRSLYLAQVFMLQVEYLRFGQETRIADKS